MDDIEAKLVTNDEGVGQWSWKPGADAQDARILELLQLGMSDADVAQEIGCNRSTVYRHRKQLKAEGVLDGPAEITSDEFG